MFVHDSSLQKKASSIFIIFFYFCKITFSRSLDFRHSQIKQILIIKKKEINKHQQI